MNIVRATTTAIAFLVAHSVTSVGGSHASMKRDIIKIKRATMTMAGLDASETDT